MARPLRVHVPGALYHVMSRGNARQQIFVADEDYAHFLDRLSMTAARCAVRCHAYCLMWNHFHLVLEPDHIPLSRMMQQLNSIYSQWFNRRRERIGHVLQGRFKAFLIDREGYFPRVLRYIALNPVRAGLVEDACDWRWSSYRATAGLEAAPSFLTLDGVWKAFAGDGPAARRLYAAFVAADAPGRVDAPMAALACGSEGFLGRVDAAVAPHRHTRDLTYADRFACRPTLDRLFIDAVDPHTRDAAMRSAFEHHGYTLREIGAFIGRPPATVWRRMHRPPSERRRGVAKTRKSRSDP
jgi:putative transposase